MFDSKTALASLEQERWILRRKLVLRSDSLVITTGTPLRTRDDHLLLQDIEGFARLHGMPGRVVLVAGLLIALGGVLLAASMVSAETRFTVAASLLYAIFVGLFVGLALAARRDLIRIEASHGRRFLLDADVPSAKAVQHFLETVHEARLQQAQRLDRQKEDLIHLDVASEISRLAALMDRRVITTEEFAMKKRQLLGFTSQTEPDDFESIN